MKQADIFNILLNRAISAEVALVAERNRAQELERRLQATATPQIEFPRHAREMMHAMANDRKIEAIKSYRTLTGASLLESKNTIEAVMNRVR